MGGSELIPPSSRFGLTGWVDGSADFESEDDSDDVTGMTDSSYDDETLETADSFSVEH
jgi:hypothetical protein